MQPFLAQKFHGFHSKLQQGRTVQSTNATIERIFSEPKTYSGPFKIPNWKARVVLQLENGMPNARLLWSVGGEQGKATGMHALLRAALHEFSPEFHRILVRGPIHLFFHFNDFPTMTKAVELRLPMFAMAATEGTTEVPVPDFTFHGYSKVSGVPGSDQWATGWVHLAKVLQQAAREVPWSQRVDSLFWRGTVRGSRTRASIVPSLELRGSELPVPLDVKEVTSSRTNDSAHPVRHNNYIALPEQCRNRYLLHLDGNAYSASLKYKLACGSLVLVVRSPYEEFFYRGLVAGVHYVAVDAPDLWNANATKRAASLDEFVARLGATLRRYRSAAGARRARAIAAQGQRFVLEQLTPGALSCYWYLALVHYARLYFGDDELPPDGCIEPDSCEPQATSNVEADGDAEGDGGTISNFLRRQWLCVGGNLGCSSL